LFAQFVFQFFDFYRELLMLAESVVHGNDSNSNAFNRLMFILTTIQTVGNGLGLLLQLFRGQSL